MSRPEVGLLAPRSRAASAPKLLPDAKPEVLSLGRRVAPRQNLDGLSCDPPLSPEI